MPTRNRIALVLATAGLVAAMLAAPSPACCPASPSGKPVVNAD